MASQGRIRFSRSWRLSLCLESMLPFLLVYRGGDSDEFRGDR